MCLACAGQTTFATNPTRFLVCDKGTGDFRGKLPGKTFGSGITVLVGAAKGNDFALRGLPGITHVARSADRGCP